MSIFGLVPTEMRAGSATAESAAAQARGSDGSAALAALADALPGSTTAGTAPELGEAWATGVSGWAEDVSEVGAAIDSITDDTSRTDAGSGAALGALGGRVGGTGR